MELGIETGLGNTPGHAVGEVLVEFCQIFVQSAQQVIHIEQFRFIGEQQRIISFLEFRAGKVFFRRIGGQLLSVCLAIGAPELAVFNPVVAQGTDEILQFLVQIVELVHHIRPGTVRKESVKGEQQKILFIQELANAGEQFFVIQKNVPVSDWFVPVHGVDQAHLLLKQFAVNTRTAPLQPGNIQRLRVKIHDDGRA